MRQRIKAGQDANCGLARGENERVGQFSLIDLASARLSALPSCISLKRSPLLFAYFVMRPRLPFSRAAGRSPPRPPTAVSRHHVERLVERAETRLLSGSWRTDDRPAGLSSLTTTPSLTFMLSRVELKAARYGVQVRATLVEVRGRRGLNDGREKRAGTVVAKRTIADEDFLGGFGGRWRLGRVPRRALLHTRARTVSRALLNGPEKLPVDARYPFLNVLSAAAVCLCRLCTLCACPRLSKSPCSVFPFPSSLR